MGLMRMFPQQIRATFNFKTKVPDCFHAVKLCCSSMTRLVSSASMRPSATPTERLASASQIVSGHMAGPGKERLMARSSRANIAVVRASSPDRVNRKFVQVGPIAKNGRSRTFSLLGSTSQNCQMRHLFELVLCHL